MTGRFLVMAPKNVILSLALATSPFCAAYGCSSSSTPSGTATDDAGGGSDATAIQEGGSNEAGARPYAGDVVISQTETDAGFSGSVSAQFYLASAATSGGCAVETSGECTFLDCSEAGTIPDPTGVHASDVTVTGGKLGAPLSLTYQSTAGGSYGSPIQSSELFAPGDTFTVTATGADVAAFSGASGQAPGDLLLSAPAPTSPDAFTIDESQDLVVSWAGGTYVDENVLVALSIGALTQVTCAFDASKGTGTVPSSLLTKLGATSTGGFAVQPESESFVVGSNATVTFDILGNPTEHGTFQTP